MQAFQAAAASSSMAVQHALIVHGSTATQTRLAVHFLYCANGMYMSAESVLMSIQ